MDKTEHGQTTNWAAPQADFCSFKVAVAEPFNLAVRVTLRFFVTLPAVAVKVANAAPAGTDTEVGTANSELLEVNTTVCGLATRRFNATVQVLEPSAVKDVGLQLREDTACVGTRSKETFWEPPFNAAVRVTVTLVVTVPAVAVKVTEVAPLDTLAELGTVSELLLAERATTLPPWGAA